MSPDRLRPPDLPERLLSAGGWSPLETREETLATLPAARVEGVTLVYGDDALRERVADATGVDRTWRFLFASRVTFSPPLAPGIEAAVRPTVARAARRAFVDDLRRRGVVDVARARRERIRTETGDRVRLRSYRGRLPVEGTALAVEGWLGVWATDDEFRVAGGAYPTDLGAFAGGADVPTPRDCRAELVAFVGGIS